MLQENNKYFIKRREKLFALMQDNSAVLMPTNSKLHRNGDAEYPFRQDSNFYYLTGFKEDNALLLLIKKSNVCKTILFCKPNNVLESRWVGKRLGPQTAKNLLELDEAYTNDDLPVKIPEFLANLDAIYYAIGHDLSFEAHLRDNLKVITSRARQGKTAPLKHIELTTLIHELRLFKDELEIQLMRQAAKISADAHIQAMKSCKAGMYEYQIEAELSYEFIRNGARYPAYTSIVAGGSNACILHYTDNNQKLNDGDLLLIDAGAEYQYYAADITRTFPVNGKFTSEQKAIYELVLKAQLAGIAVARVGNPWNQMQAAILEVLVAGLIDLEILSGTVKENIDKEIYKEFYMHNSGHWLGIDVHDAGSYKVNDNWRPLEPGMVLTVEPGLYFAEDCTKIDKKWRGIGVRIEDDVLVTNEGPEILTEALPKTIDAIESLMNK